MRPSYIFNRLLIVLSFLLIVTTLIAQEQTGDYNYQPESGQEGKDVIWVPTPQLLVDKMLDLAKVTTGDYLMDLGSGDGRLVITAVKRGATALGIEYNQEMVDLSIRNAAKEGVSSKAKFLQADLFETDLSKATVITLFLLPGLNLKLRPRLLELKPGTRIVSNTFTMEEWEPDDSVILDYDCHSWCKAYLWIIPARAEGKWKLDQGELIIKQEFQEISGIFKNGNSSVEISDGRLKGFEISFKANGADYTGTLSGNKIEGICTIGGDAKKWSASR
jgi:hypothetical protein